MSYQHLSQANERVIPVVESAQQPPESQHHPQSSTVSDMENNNINNNKNTNDDTNNHSTGNAPKKAAFVHKLYAMLSDPKLSNLIWWTNGAEDGTFALQPGAEFAQALTGYFKHGNVASFVRQLHMYGFHKVCEPPSNHHSNVEDTNQAVWEFIHSNGMFKKGDQASLALIKRRTSSNTSKMKSEINGNMSGTPGVDVAFQHQNQQQYYYTPYNQQQNVQHQQQQQQQQQPYPMQAVPPYPVTVVQAPQGATQVPPPAIYAPQSVLYYPVPHRYSASSQQASPYPPPPVTPPFLDHQQKQQQQHAASQQQYQAAYIAQHYPQAVPLPQGLLPTSPHSARSHSYIAQQQQQQQPYASQHAYYQQQALQPPLPLPMPMSTSQQQVPHRQGTPTSSAASHPHVQSRSVTPHGSAQDPRVSSYMERLSNTSRDLLHSQQLLHAKSEILTGDLKETSNDVVKSADSLKTVRASLSEAQYPAEYHSRINSLRGSLSGRAERYEQADTSSEYAAGSRSHQASIVSNSSQISFYENNGRPRIPSMFVDPLAPAPAKATPPPAQPTQQQPPAQPQQPVAQPHTPASPHHTPDAASAPMMSSQQPGAASATAPSQVPPDFRQSSWSPSQHRGSIAGLGISDPSSQSVLRRSGSHPEFPTQKAIRLSDRPPRSIPNDSLLHPSTSSSSLSASGKPDAQGPNIAPGPRTSIPGISHLHSQIRPSLVEFHRSTSPLNTSSSIASSAKGDSIFSNKASLSTVSSSARNSIPQLLNDPVREDANPPSSISSSQPAVAAAPQPATQQHSEYHQHPTPHHGPHHSHLLHHLHQKPETSNPDFRRKPSVTPTSPKAFGAASNSGSQDYKPQPYTPKQFNRPMNSALRNNSAVVSPKSARHNSTTNPGTTTEIPAAKPAAAQLSDQVKRESEEVADESSHQAKKARGE